MKLRCLFLLGAAFLALNSGSVNAYVWWTPHGYPVWWRGGQTCTNEYIPYFAKHPPVYYSRPVARPYGYYPYAYPPAAHASWTIPTSPLLVKNHYMALEAKGSDHKASSPTPLRIVNPFARESDQPLDAP